MPALAPNTVYYGDADALFADVTLLPLEASVIDIRATVFLDRHGPEELQAALGTRYLYVKQWGRPGCQGGDYESPSLMRIPGFPLGLDQVRNSGLVLTTGVIICCGCLRLYDSNHGSLVARQAAVSLLLLYGGYYNG